MRTRAFCVCWFLLLSGLGGGALADQITIDIPVTPFAVTKDAQGLAKFTGQEIQFLTTAGEPALPYQVVKALLPPDARLETVAVSIENPRLEPVAGFWEVAPTAPASTWRDGRPFTVWPEDRAIVNGKDEEIYGQDALFPASLLGSVTCGQMRNWKLVEIPLALCRHNPVTRQLLRLTRGRLTVSFHRQPSDLAPLAFGSGSSDRIGARRVKRIAVNFNEMAPAYQSSGPKISAAGAGSRYVILTTRAIETGSDQLDDFVSSKKQRGFTVDVVTEEEWGGGTGNRAAENIRAWLQGNYLGRGIEHVLLIGNPHPTSGSVPMKMLWPRRNETTYQESPSDYYYADLTGDWDLDGDGYYGEWNQDFGPGGVDRNWDVIVGRIPYYGNMTDLDRILAKIVAYENADQAENTWRRNVLLPMKASDQYTSGYHLGEEIRIGVLAAKKGWTYHRVYDSNPDVEPETVGCTVDNVTAAWNGADYGAVFWWTHGWEQEAVDVMDIAHAATLDDDHPAVTFQASCHNSTPEDNSNLSSAILKNGGIATVSATRASWYQPGQENFAGSATNAGLAYEYAQRVIGEEMTCGEALLEAKQQVRPSDNEWWMNYTDFNLYGDPATLLVVGDQRILDNGDAGTSAKGTWSLQLPADSFGDNCQVSTQSGATYEYAASVSGAQEVFLWWTDAAGRCADVEVRVYNGSSLLGSFNIDQRKNGGRWNSLGTFKFSGSARIVILSGGTCSASADAAMWDPRTVWQVAANAPAGGDGTTWAQAFQSIDQAVTAAYSGDEIWVKEGSYPISQTIEADKLNLEIYGGFDGTEIARVQRDPKGNPTVVDGSDAVRCFHLSAETTLDGLTISNGNADGSYPDNCGGAVLVDAASTIANCTFTNNYARRSGGAIYITPGANLFVSHSTFTDNESGYRGGAIHGDADYFTVTDSTFLRNTTRYDGGAVYAEAGCSPSIANTVFVENSANQGGGFYCQSDSYARIVNCTFVDNDAVTAGGGLRCQDAAPAVTNSIFWQNSAPTHPQIGYEAGNAPAVGFSDIDQESFAGAKGNIRKDPNFVDIDQDNLHLKADSPCIDAGQTAAAVNLPSDLGDVKRPLDGDEDDRPVIDMGAFEYVADGDGLPDAWEMDYFDSLDQSAAGDADKDGLTNIEEFDLETDPTNPDTDGDELPDGWEATHQLDPLDGTGDNGKNGDPDGDGWTNYVEFQKNADPRVARAAARISLETVQFGTVEVGKQEVVSLTLENTQVGDLKVGTVQIEGQNASDFKIQDDGCSGKVLAKAEKGSLGVVFAPASAGAKTATLRIPSNDPENPVVTVSLSGTATGDSISPPPSPGGGGGGGGGGCFIGASSLF